jgi:hypothetical protein
MCDARCDQVAQYIHEQYCTLGGELFIVPSDRDLLMSWAAERPVQYTAFAYWKDRPLIDLDASRWAGETLVQQNVEWKNARQAFVSASEVAEMCGLGYRQVTGTEERYLSDCMTSFRGTDFDTDDVAYGRLKESELRTRYENRTNTKIRRIGLCVASYFAASPDGLVAERGIVEFKTTTEASTPLPAERHIVQIQMTLKCCPEREWCDLVVLYRGSATIRCWRVFRSNAAIDMLTTVCRMYLDCVYASRRGLSISKPPMLPCRTIQNAVAIIDREWFLT